MHRMLDLSSSQKIVFLSDKKTARAKQCVQVLDRAISFLGLDNGELLLHALVDVFATLNMRGEKATVTTSQISRTKELLLGALADVLKGRATQLTEARERSWIELFDCVSYHLMVSQMKLEYSSHSTVPIASFRLEISQ